MSSLSVRKGKDGEDEAAALLSRLFEKEVVRAKQAAVAQGKEQEPDLRGLKHLYPEVKRRRSIDLHKVLGKELPKLPRGAVPFVIHRKDRAQWLITIEADRLLEFTEAVEEELREG